ncbi:MAG: AAA family ATPase [Gemmatimonadetes bacterium]|nr:AAA family ATPase [Gemmatimonadota bacterium]
MNRKAPAPIAMLPTGVPGLDDVLGGGLPEYSFNVIAGEPGSGKTTMAHQIMFSNSTPERCALYFTVLGEPPIKMLRYQQQFSFFDPDKLDGAIRFVNLSQEVMEQDLGVVLDRIVREVEETSPGVVVVDSFRSVARAAQTIPRGELELQSFLQCLAIHLTGWQATTFLVGEYTDVETRDNPVFTVADGVLRLSQSVDRNSIVRKLQVVKSRGQSPMPGLHTVRITGDGVQVFPRIVASVEESARETPRGRVSTGVPELDEMLGGGIPMGDSVLIAGPSGSGKSVLASQFIAAGAERNEPGVLIVFEEHPKEYLHRAQALGFDLDGMVRRHMLSVIYLRPLDLSPDETLYEIRESANRVRAKRVVIDSMSGFELALAPTFREDFRESLYRLVGSLTGAGITVLTTMEIVQIGTGLRFTPNVVSFLADDIILQRYVEMEGQLRKILTVVKMRGSQHSKDFRAYEIGPGGLVIGEALRAYQDILSGAPRLRENHQ